MWSRELGRHILRRASLSGWSASQPARARLPGREGCAVVSSPNCSILPRSTTPARTLWSSPPARSSAEEERPPCEPSQPQSTLSALSASSAADPTNSPGSLPGSTAPSVASSMPNLPGSEGAGPSTALTPRRVVTELDRHIVGQGEAKRAVANALRGRWRRRRVPSPLREDITPKNILMIGPTGCGKTEIARRLAKLCDAPFVKVEATKFTEVGFHGRDVDQIVRDLVENAIVLARARQRRLRAGAIALAVEERVLGALLGENASPETRESFRKLYRDGALEERRLELDLPAAGGGAPRLLGGGGVDLSSGSIQEMVIRVDRLIGDAGSQKKSSEARKSMTVAEARPVLEEQEAERLSSGDALVREAVASAEQDGIVFIDEIDKIVSSSEGRSGADASSEGVQRDLLPIIEGSVVGTKHGNVRTDHMLFIASGAFHACKPSDMLAELQGRLPIRVELRGLSESDLLRILEEPDSSMLRQQVALLATEGVDLEFSPEAVREVARVAAEVNATVDNIGARRLHTVLERILEDVSFDAPDMAKDGERARVVVGVEDVRKKIGDLFKKQDLSKYVL